MAKIGTSSNAQQPVQTQDQQPVGLWDAVVEFVTSTRTQVSEDLLIQRVNKCAVETKNDLYNLLTKPIYNTSEQDDVIIAN